MLATKHLAVAIKKAFSLINKDHKDYYKPFRCSGELYDPIYVWDDGNQIAVQGIQPVVLYVGLSPIYNIPKEEVVRECELGPFEYEYKMKLYRLIIESIYRLQNDLPVKGDQDNHKAIRRFANLQELVMNKLVEMRPGEFVDLRKAIAV